MKKLNNLFFIFSIPFLVLIMTSCIYTGDFGPMVEQERRVGDFEGIKVTTGIDVFLSHRSRSEVIVKASENIIDDVETEVVNGILKVQIERRRWFTGGDVDVYITFVDIESIDVSAGSDVRSNEYLRFEDIDIEASSGSDIKLDLEARRLDVRTSSGSDASLSGSARDLRAKSSSGSDIHAYNLEVENARVDCSSGSDIKVWVTRSIEGRASSGSDINVKGNPDIRDVNTSGGSDVRYRSE